MIRKIQETDKNEFIKMTSDFYSSSAVEKKIPLSYHEKTFNHLMESEVYAQAIVVENENELMGYILVAKTFSQEAGGMVVWLEEIYVKDNFHGKGIGTAMIKYVEENIKASRYRLEVEDDNEKAVGLYKKLGYSYLEYRQMRKDV